MYAICYGGKTELKMAFFYYLKCTVQSKAMSNMQHRCIYITDGADGILTPK